MIVVRRGLRRMNQLGLCLWTTPGTGGRCLRPAPYYPETRLQPHGQTDPGMTRETQTLILYVSKVRPQLICATQQSPAPAIPSLSFVTYTSLFFPFVHFHILSLPCSCRWYPWSLLTVPLGALSLSPEDTGLAPTHLLSGQQEVRSQCG